MPPVSDIIDALIYAVLPSAATAIVVYIVTVKLAGKRFDMAAGALALALGFLAGNGFRGAVEFRLDSERVLTPAELGQALVDSFVPPKDDDTPIPPPARYWIPWTTTLALLGGLLTVQLKPSLRWIIRAVLAAFAASLAIPPDVRAGMLWSVPVLSAIIFGEWFLLDGLATVEQEHLRLIPLLAGVLAFGGASIVLLHAHSARFVDIATIAAASLAAVSLGAWMLQRDSRGAIPGVAVALPCLMLAGHQDTFSAVPAISFVLVAIAPLSLAPFLMGRVRRLRPTISWFAGVVLVLAPMSIAIALAAASESLSFE